MALTKPILNNVNAWDKANGQTFTFNVIGGDAVVGNTLYILDNSNNTVVYTLNTTSFQYKAVVPSNAIGLVNGTYYSAYVVTHNSNNDNSPNSNIIQFYCYTTPSWAITNITSGSIVTKSSIAPQISYSQSEGEALNDYTFNLYNSSQILLSSSGVLYTNSSASTYTASYDFLGLEDNTVYYIQTVGHTVNGTLLDTNLIEFTVSYSQPETYNVLVLQNNCDGGYITYYSLAYVIEGISNPSPPTYTTDGVNLKNAGSYVIWQDNYNIENNFTVKGWIKSANLDTTILMLSNGNNDYIEVQYITDPENSNKIRIALQVYSNNLPSYYIYSNSINKPNNNTVICFQIRRINNIYDIVIGVV